MTEPTRIDIDNGKYTIVFGGDPHVPVHFLRYGEDWIRPGDLQASNAWIAAACEIEDLRSKIENANQAASETHSDWESRCHAIMNALGEDYGSCCTPGCPTPWKAPRRSRP
jgi:hypothetical protein